MRIPQSHFQPCGLGRRTREDGVDSASMLHLVSVWRLRWSHLHLEVPNPQEVRGEKERNGIIVSIEVEVETFKGFKY